jgi:nitrite reductase/ring-hydroxylating ferredoxin subunit
MDKSKIITRREFLKVTGLIAGSAAIGSMPFLAGCGFPTAPEIDDKAYTFEGNISVVLEKVPQLSRVGGSAAILNDSRQIHLIIARIAEDQFVVALNECPHREKLLGYDHDARHFICASGKSEFRLDGSIVARPAEYPLPIYQCRLEGNRLTIDLETNRLEAEYENINLV